MTKIFTIGFSGKKPNDFMDILNATQISCVWDIRLWRTSRFVPFYSGTNLATVLGNRYEYHPEFAPSTEILTGYKDGHLTWTDYERVYRELLASRQPTAGLELAVLNRICLLCTEKSAAQCHRRLAAEYIATQFPDTEIVHL